MSKLRNKVILLTVMSCIVTGCHINTKPDHPQIRESFSERRSPKDNALAESGALGDNSSNSNFKGVRDAKVGTALNGNSSRNDSSSGFLGTTFGGSSSSSYGSGSSSSSSGLDESFFSKLWRKLFSENQSNTNFYPEDRSYPVANNMITNENLGQGSRDTKLSYYERADEILPSNKTQSISSNSIEPIHNESKALSDAKYGYMLANGNITHSISNASLSNTKSGTWKKTMSDNNPMRLAEVSDEIKKSVVDLDKPLSSNEDVSNSIRNAMPSRENPTEPVPAQPVTPEMTEPSASEAPKPVENEALKTDNMNSDIPSIEELRKKSEEIQAPELKDIPQKPQIKKEEPKNDIIKPQSKNTSSKPIKSAKKSYSSTKYRDPINDVTPTSVEIQEPNARIEIENGKHLVRGSLGTLRK